MTSETDIKLTSVSAALLEPESWHRRAIIYAICCTLGFAIVWSYFTPVAEVSSGLGRVIPENKLQVVQSADAGTISEILAKPGDKVQRGEIIARMDPVAASASVTEAEVQLASLEAMAVRLRAQLAAIEGDDGNGRSELQRLSPDDDDPIGGRLSDVLTRRQAGYRQWLAADVTFRKELGITHPDLVRQAEAQFRSGLEELVTSLSSFDQQMSQRQQAQAEARTRLRTTETSLELAEDQLRVLEKLKRTGAASRSEVLAAKAKVNDLSGGVGQLQIAVARFNTEIAEIEDRRSERLNNFRNTTSSLLTEAETKQAAITASLTALTQRAERTAVRATATGALKSMNVTSVGQVLRPGDIIAEIVPSEGGLLVQAKVKPEDIAFIEPGMPAVIKLTAYDYSIFGGLPGRLERVADDATTDEQGNIYYIADIRASRDFVERRGEKWPILPGMVANVDIVTGKRSIFQYITKPIHRMTTMSLRER